MNWKTGKVLLKEWKTEIYKWREEEELTKKQIKRERGEQSG